MWLNNLRSGRGMFIEKNQAAYTGEYLDGKREGFGTHRTKNGNKYVG